MGAGNNDRLVKEVLTDGHGFKLLQRGMMFSNDYRLKWTQTSMEVNYMHFKEGTHLCNHVANATRILTTKIALIEVLEGLKVAMELGLIKSDIYPTTSFAPETYRLDVVADLHQFLTCETNGVWLEKKSQSNMGRGIKLIADVKQYR